MKAYFKLLAAVLLLIGVLVLNGTFLTPPQYESPQNLEGAAFAFTHSRMTSGDTNSTIVVDSNQREAILSATVCITLIAPQLDEVGAPVLMIQDGKLKPKLILNKGLGTAVRDGKRTLIVTHDHWSQLTDHLLQVRINAHDGRPLAIISGFVFRNLIQYRDGGTLIFLAPEGVQSTAALVDGDLLRTDDLLLMVHVRSEDGLLDIVPVQVTEVNLSLRPETVQFHLPFGEKVMQGNSGCGIWLNGDLVANLWFVKLKYEMAVDSTVKPDLAEGEVTKSVAALIPDLPPFDSHYGGHRE